MENSDIQTGAAGVMIIMMVMMKIMCNALFYTERMTVSWQAADVLTAPITATAPSVASTF